MTGWETTVSEPSLPNVKDTLNKRSMKRKGYKAGPNFWIVLGDHKLGDHYESYEVRLEGKYYNCSCQGHMGGDYRKYCSHINYVVLVKRGFADFIEAPEPEEPDFTVEEVDTSVDQYLLPDWVKELRPHQVKAVEEILYHFQQG